MPGENCNNGFVNDAYYEIKTSTVCIDDRTTSITAPDVFAGGGGGPTVLSSINIP